MRRRDVLLWELGASFAADMVVGRFGLDVDRVAGVKFVSAGMLWMFETGFVAEWVDENRRIVLLFAAVVVALGQMVLLVSVVLADTVTVPVVVVAEQVIAGVLWKRCTVVAVAELGHGVGGML